jgi:hypothetical protein
MYHADNVAFYISPLEQVQYYFSHQPAILSLVLAYALACLLLYWVTRGRGFLIAMASGVFYLFPMIMHMASA